MEAKDLFFELVADLIKKLHSYYYKNGGKNSFPTYLCSKVDL